MKTQPHVAIITGAGGMAGHDAGGLHRAGIRLLAVDRDRKPADLTHGPVIADILVATLKQFGRVDILVDKADIGQGIIRADNWKNSIRF